MEWEPQNPLGSASPPWHGQLLPGSTVSGRHRAGEHLPVYYPLHSGLAGKIINVSCALNNVDKTVLYTSLVLENNGQAKDRRVRKSHHHEAAPSQTSCHEVVHPAQGHITTPKLDSCKGWHF